MPCGAISVEENELVIVCELIKIFPSKCTDKLICIYVHMYCICAYMYVCMCVFMHAYARAQQTWMFEHSLGKAYELSSFVERKNTHIV